ncbi:unnamed protein product [Prorocentrum cordatum]|uniref:Uncharacterized protein n=1 Tax=Prorocentrum cordatum TaxID=2364126 RepID=A0ABN9UQ63_9DINO|nr:unnamed protein product [Polarella glacialis]
MRVFVFSCSGRELADLPASPSWHLQDVLEALPKDTGAPLCERRLLFGERELCESLTLADLGASGTVELTLVITPPLRVVCAGRDGAAKIFSAATAECLCVLKNDTHGSDVRSVMFSTDGKQVFTVSHDHSARVWCASSGECLLALGNFKDDPVSAVFSHDGEQVLVASDCLARVWSITSATCLSTLEGHQDLVQSAVFSPDGCHALTASSDCTAKIWSTASGVCSRTLDGHLDYVQSAAYSSSGDAVLTVSFDCTAKIWSASSGMCLHTLEHQEDYVKRAVFSPDCKMVLTFFNSTAKGLVRPHCQGTPRAEPAAPPTLRSAAALQQRRRGTRGAPMPPERRRPPGECGLGVRLRVEARLEGSASRADCLELRAAGSPEECFARLEYATLAWFGAAVTCGFQLLVEAAGTSAALLTPSHLRDSFLWNHGHICVKVRPAIRLRGRSVFEHGRWIHAAASTIQRRWQLYRRWRQWVEAEDILCAFDLAVSRQGLRVWNPVPLAQADTSSPSLVADPKLLRLAVVLLTCMPCQSQPEKLFLQWAEQRSVFFVVQAAAEFTQCLSELAFDRWPGCRNVLGLLVRELLNKLGSAFPFMVEPAVEQHVEAVAAAAATAAKRRRGSCSSGEVLRRSFETGIQSAVLACVLQMASEAIWSSATSFHDEELLWRIRDMPSYRQVLATVQQLQPGADNERLLLLRPAGLPHVVGEEVLLLPARRSENLGVALQASCLFYGVDYAKLCLDVAEEHTGFGEHALPVETIVGSIPAEGTFLTLWVQYESPEPGSFERALQDIVNAVGSRFSLDRQHCICKLEARWSSPEVTPEVPEMPLGLGDTLVLPEVYSGETQYFHFYDSVERRMTTVRCPLASIVKALREECALVHGEPLAQVPFAHLAKHVARPTSLLGSMRGLQRRLDHWLQAPFSGADVEPKNLDYRNCSAWLTPGFLPAQVAKATRGLAQVAPGIVGRGLRGGAPGDAARAGRAGRLRDGAAAGAAADAEEEQQRQKGFRDFFRCDVKGRLEKNGGPRVYHDFFSSEKKGQEKRPVAAKAASGTSASKLAKRPESVVPVMAAAAASSAPLVLFQPLTKWSLVEVQKLSAHQAVLPSQWGVSLPHGATLASGALAGATLGGMLAPRPL